MVDYRVVLFSALFVAVLASPFLTAYFNIPNQDVSFRDRIWGYNTSAVWFTHTPSTLYINSSICLWNATAVAWDCAHGGWNVSGINGSVCTDTFATNLSDGVTWNWTPYNTSVFDLGNTTNLWHDLFINGNLTDPTPTWGGSCTVAQACDTGDYSPWEDDGETVYPKDYNRAILINANLTVGDWDPVNSTVTNDTVTTTNYCFLSGGCFNASNFTSGGTTYYSDETFINKNASNSFNLNETKLNASIDARGGGVPAGVDGNVQFNDGGAFGGAKFLNWDKNTSRLSLGITQKIPVMTSNTAPSPYVATASAEINWDNALFRATTPNPTNGWICQFSYGWAQFDFSTTYQFAANQYRIQGSSTTANSPKNWTFIGSNDNSSWTILDTQTGITWTSLESKTFDISNTAVYRYYQWNITANNGGSWITIRNLKIYGPVAPSALITIGTSNGSAGYAPLKFNSGVLLATAEAGTIEYDGSNLLIRGGDGLNMTSGRFLGYKQLTFQQDGDVYGSTRLTIASRTGLNGALFQMIGGPALVDFGFAPDDVSANQRNIRMENRGGSQFVSIPEFQFGVAANPNFVVGDNAALFRRGGVEVNGTVTATGFNANGFAGINATVVIGNLTSGGANGTLDFVNGLLVSATNST